MSPAAAVAVQERLRGRVIRAGSPGCRTVAGVDVSEKDGRARAAVVVMRGPETVEEAVAETAIPFPYVPGLLSFREIPPLLAAWRKVRTRPDVVIVDGQGAAHPRRFGLACHLGVLLGVATIGCAKSLLVGRYEEPAPERGSCSPLVDRGETVGAALRTQDGTNVVYVSVGHRISLAAAVRTVLACAPLYRLPDPQRLADRLSKRR